MPRGKSSDGSRQTKPFLPHKYTLRERGNRSDPSPGRPHPPLGSEGASNPTPSWGCPPVAELTTNHRRPSGPFVGAASIESTPGVSIRSHMGHKEAGPKDRLGKCARKLPYFRHEFTSFPIVQSTL